MRLIADYPQYYDTVFDGQGPLFHRMAFGRGGLSKREQFALFEKLNLATPPHGTVAELAARHPPPRVWDVSLAPWWAETVQLVVYEDEYAHGGAGKQRIPLGRAAERHAGVFASLYIPPAGNAINFRYARLGRIGIWLRQEGGEGEWRSNRRDTETVLTRHRHQEALPLPRALWAIDFIPSPAGLLAIDFNTAPDLDILGESRTLAPEEVVEELAFAANQNPESLRQF
jgi:hypothetical protein